MLFFDRAMLAMGNVRPPLSPYKPLFALTPLTTRPF